MPNNLEDITERSLEFNLKMRDRRYIRLVEVLMTAAYYRGVSIRVKLKRGGYSKSAVIFYSGAKEDVDIFSSLLITIAESWT